ncbi:hypothetical protein M011DRAFT_409490 [Sporormia fimetaria CBS 119925]|uniref:NADH dehydrogenase [ubiquinone] 1 beta subcomplex subunit 4 n=1 Tax=Sporormia fimetaria CBS 119925 TaxID=1340428 RepID=A0A6A6V356_9PLEO|nr:hypothetical protein M011DRAFT_409490 [Sporormia fimetaria CBS 119925]
MAGHGHGPVRMDPALMKWYKMTNNRHKYFRWNKRTAFIGFMFVIATPVTLYQVLAPFEGKYDMRGKRRGDLIAEF